MKALLHCVALGATLAAAFSQPLPYDPTPLWDSVQDGAGRVWAIGNKSDLLLWRGDRWEPQAVDLPTPDNHPVTAADGSKAAFPRLLQTNRLGTLHVVWAGQDRNDETKTPHWITRMNGTQPPDSAVFMACLIAPSLTFESDGTGWLTSAGPEVYRIQPDLTVEHALTIASNRMAGTRFDQRNPIHTLALPRGGVLVWGEQRFRELATLRGLLIASGTNRIETLPIEGLPDRGFSALEAIEPTRLWMGVPSWDDAAGLYELDLETRRAQRLAEPAPGAFAHVVEILSTANNRFIVAGESSLRLALWRQREGAWDRVAFPLDSASFDDYYRVTRPVVSDAHATWIGTGGNGMLRIPSSRDTAPTVFDWRMGQPLESVHRIFRIPQGEWLLAGFGQGTTHAQPANLVQGRLISPRLIDLWKSAGNLQRDTRGHLWTLFAPVGEEATLGEWDGNVWEFHPLPARVRPGGVGSPIGIDSLGRFWVPYRERLWIAEHRELKLTDKVVLYLPATDEWLPFDSMEDAFVDLIRTDPRGRLDLPGGSRYQPAFSDRGEICFLGRDWTRADRAVHFHDGRQWHRWDLAAVGFKRPGYFGQPFFTPDGKLAINFTRGSGARVTAILEGGEWRTAPFQSAGPRDPDRWMRSPETRPSEGGAGQGGVEGGGEAWKAEARQWVHSSRGLSMPQFEWEHVHPFIGGRRIEQVWIDARGNFVLGTALPAGNLSGLRQYVVLAPTKAMHPSQVDLVQVKEVEVELRREDRSRVTEDGVTQSVPGGPTSEASGFTAVEIQDGQILLHWSGAGVLEVADHVEGPWTPLPGAASPHAILMTKPSEFYRVRKPSGE